jgi:hypothetical protein
VSDEIIDGQGNTGPGNDEQQQAEQVTEQPGATTETEPGADATGEPVEYEAFTLPEGVEMDAEVLDEFKPIAKELGLDQAKAQQLVDLGSKIAAKMHESGIEAWRKQTSEWADQARADQEVGGKEFDANLGTALAAVEKFGTPELKTILDESGFGNHPEVVRFMYRVGKAISSDAKLVTGKPRDSRTMEQVMYPTMAKP